MAKDIEEFLKMAAARRREAQAAAPAPAPATPPRTTPQRVPPKQKKQPQRPIVITDSEVEIVPPKRESVAKHVESRIDTKRLQEHAQRLGEKVGRADDVLEARLHQKFDHQVGRLATPASALVDSGAKPGKQPAHATRALLNMLVSPQTVQQAIIMSEILKRPEWD